MRLWFYRLRFILAGVRILRRHGWPLTVAWSSVAADFDSDGIERHEGYTPEDSAAEALSYWD
jgi:hypothetical protein